MTDRIELAARNNALWCDGVCRSHGISGTFGSAVWSSPVRTPPLYPDAVTLTESTSELDILQRIDAAAGASIKDSWASLDLTRADFAPLIAGEWLWLDADDAAARTGGDGGTWREVRSAAQMEGWSRAWASAPQDAVILGPSLLAEEGVKVLAATEGEHVTAGCIVNVTGQVAGITNVFAADGDDARAWVGAAAAAALVAPGHHLVGWESGDGVAAARAARFDTIGPLTVWIR
ncbi:hypothetical protein ACOCJ7_09720 [Knoellia sp. CPCC 206453]|uniref:hypothetical protein n=1 Tax=Knoellia pratensis TaxID=3404796 RepID=UPI003608585D